MAPTERSRAGAAKPARSRKASGEAKAKRLVAELREQTAGEPPRLLPAGGLRFRHGRSLDRFSSQRAPDRVYLLAGRLAGQTRR